MSSNSLKSARLGMPWGTANGRLRKMILFRCVQKLGEDFCFRCGDKIESIGDFSIEHKDRWEGVSVDLFWDLENIAFSHVKCNRPSTETRGRIQPPRGMSWCTGHKRFEPIKNFRTTGLSIIDRRWNGLDRRCRDYHAERVKKQRQKRGHH